MAIINGISIPLPSDEGMIQRDGKAHDGDSASGIHNGQLWTVCRAPFQVHKGNGGSAFDEVASGGFTETPCSAVRMASQKPELKVLPIRSQRSDGARS